MLRLLLTVTLGLSAASLTAADLFPLDQVKAGLRGTGRTVFSGEQVEEFEVEILGVLNNIAPGESLILARLKGGPLAKTGVAAGMSGSPVYLDGKLAGAVAYSFPFSTEPIAGIRPIHEMIERLDDAPASPANRASRSVDPAWAVAESGGRFIPNPQAELWPAGPQAAPSDPQLLPIATPVALAGFSERTFEVFGKQLRRLGLRPAQGVGGRGASDEPPSPPKPGAMIGVALIQGDMELSAAGTVTLVENNRLYAFGHRFLSSGPTEMPLLGSSVIAMVPNLNNSFKIAASGGPLGVITQDRASGIFGELGRSAKLLPLEISLKSNGQQRRYKMELVKDRTLSPFLMQMAVFSAVDTTERQVGASSYRVSGRVDLGDGLPPLRLDNMYAGSNGVALQMATLTSIPLAYLLNLDFKDIAPRGIDLEIEVIDEEQRLDIDRGWASKTRARAGESIELAAALRDGAGHEIVKKTSFQIPPGTKPGVLEVTFSDGGSLNMLDWRIFASPARAENAAKLVRAMNRLRRNDRLYVRVWQSSQAFLLNTERLPSPPASVLALLSSPRAQGGGVTADWQSTIEEFELGGFDSVIQGSVSTRITVIE
ncbi:MAG: hypothetical protein O2968_00150 [Acidobacteria bacterium]|nr:hypothetical protein [Acidobacteriota bacterium]